MIVVTMVIILVRNSKIPGNQDTHVYKEVQHVSLAMPTLPVGTWNLKLMSNIGQYHGTTSINPILTSS